MYYTKFQGYACVCVRTCMRELCVSVYMRVRVLRAQAQRQTETRPATYSAVAMFMIATTIGASWQLPETSTIDGYRARLFVRVTNHESLSLVADASEKQRKNVVNFVVSVDNFDCVIVAAARVSVALRPAPRQQRETAHGTTRVETHRHKQLGR